MGPIDPADAALRVERALDAAAALHLQCRRADLSPLVRAASMVTEALRAGGKVLAFGNGGSAADAQHLAAELVGRFLRERAGLAAIALSTDSSVVTSIGNDYGFERVFARQIEALGRPGDVVVAISTSGRSANVRAGVDVAAARGLRTVAFTGRPGGPLDAAVDVLVSVPDDSAARVQEVHRTLLHALCEIVESAV